MSNVNVFATKDNGQLENTTNYNIPYVTHMVSKQRKIFFFFLILI